ncbi:hypothetical protein ACHAWF_015978, partial [Thalassiosira exigua]
VAVAADLPPSAPSRDRDPTQDAYLTFSRNLFLQTPRPLAPTAIDRIWDAATARKFAVAAPIAPERSARGGRARGKRKASSMSLDEATDDDGSLRGSVPPSPAKSAVEGAAATKAPVSEVERSLTQAQEKLAQCHEPSGEPSLPLCGLEDDERALSYLQVNHHGHIPKAELSIMANSDLGYGIRQRRKLKKKRKEGREAYSDATTFTSESWRWRVHQSRPTMLGDYRSSRDPTYDYYDPAPVDMDELLGDGGPWRLRPHNDESTDNEEERRPAVRPRSFSISWSAEEIEKAKGIWKSILAYTNSVLDKIESKAGDSSSKTPLRDLLELVDKAHALPTPEEAFGRRDPSARQMSGNMNEIINAIESGRDCVARIFKCLKDDGEGIELDVLSKSIDTIEQSCPVLLTELDTVKGQLQEATLWEEKLESNVDHGTADSEASEGEDVITEKKLTLEKVERLVSKGRNLSLRPRSLVKLLYRIEQAHVLRRRISVWNEAREQENPQNIKFVSTLIKQANKIDLAFPELFTLTGVHRKAEEWMDRASIAVRTTISFEELESLVSVGESLPLNVSDVLEKLQNRLKQAQEWMVRVDEIVPKSESYLTWLRRFREALGDSEKNAHLLSLLSEGSRIPVTMHCSKLLQIEIDARHWAAKARPWIPQNLVEPDGEARGPQKRGKIDDVNDHLDRASSIRDRIWFGDKEKLEWVLDGESELSEMVQMAQTWFEKYDDIINYDSRRSGKLCLPMSKLHTIVEEVNQIPLNLGNPATKLNRMFSQADEWMNTYYGLVKRCGIECDYVPSSASKLQEGVAKPLKIEELTAAVADADSDLSINLEVVGLLRERLEKAQIWVEKANTVAPRKDPRRKGKQQEKHSLKYLSDLIDESPMIKVDITDELERLKIEQSAVMSWRLQAQQTIKEIMTAFNKFLKERASNAAGFNDSASDVLSSSTHADLAPSVNPVVSGSMTTRNINSRRRALSSAGTSGSETPACAENGGKYLFPLVSSFLKSVKSTNTLTPEGSSSHELSEVMSWFTKTFKMSNALSEVYDRKNFSKLDSLIEAGQKLAGFENMSAETIPEDPKLLHNLRQSWAAAAKHDIGRLLELQNQRNKFVEWCEKADEIISSTDKKVSIEVLQALEKQSQDFPSCEQILLQ